MILFPNAKINIGLDILRRRPDGYHDISTVMCPVGWRDVLEIVPSASGETSLNVTGRTVDCPPEKNLVMKAYRRLSEAMPLPPVDIYLHKVIPDGAGLGGGSADAAFMLIGLNRLFCLGLSDEQLAETAASLGADCAFFIYNRPMLCEGTGTSMTPVDLDISHYCIAIVKPPVSVPTAQAYAGCTPAEPESPLLSRLTLPVERWSGIVKNDFEPSIARLHSEIEHIKNGLTGMGAIYTAMSGSGSAVFGLFNHDILADELRALFADHDIFVQPAQ